jgi:hypothetical protein
VPLFQQRVQRHDQVQVHPPHGARDIHAVIMPVKNLNIDDVDDGHR